MMILDLVFAIFIAMILASLITGPVGWRHPRLHNAQPTGRRATGMFLFLILLPLIWAGGLWLSPMGPEVSGSYWLPPLLVGLLVALLVLAVGSAGGPTTLGDNARAGAGAEPDIGEAATIGITALFGLFFWLLLLGAAAAITVFYVA